jgi:non-structural maintenance of chromosomes element 4
LFFVFCFWREKKTWIFRIAFRKMSSQLTQEELVLRQKSRAEANAQRKLVAKKTRKRYRDLRDKTESAPESSGEQLVHALKKTNLIFDNVVAPREAVLDSGMLRLLSDRGVETTKRVSIKFADYSASDFLQCLKERMQGRARAKSNQQGAQQHVSGDNASDDDDDNDDDDCRSSSSSSSSRRGHALDWRVVGSDASALFRHCPSAAYMNGPIHTEVKVRQKIVREKQKVEKVVQLEELSVAESNQGVENETSHCVELLVPLLEKKKRANFWDFVVDPDSFTQTIENVFHVAFLIQHGWAATDVDEDDSEIALVSHAPATEGSQLDSQLSQPPTAATTNQCVVKINHRLWGHVRQRVDGPSIPHRDYRSLQQQPKRRRKK